MKNEIIELFNGGHPSPLLNGLKCANCGKHIKVNNNFYEVMSKNISSHASNIISKYIFIDGKKLEFSCWLNNELQYQFGLAYYKNKGDNQSYRYTQKIPTKYQRYLNEISSIFYLVFENQKDDIS